MPPSTAESSPIPGGATEAQNWETSFRSEEGTAPIRKETPAIYHGTAELPAQALSAEGSVDIISRAELVTCERWKNAFNAERKDHRFYELVEDTIRQGFDYRYFVLRGMSPSSSLIRTCSRVSAPGCEDWSALSVAYGRGF
jgi:hypothetical protein